MKIDINKKYRTRDGREVNYLHRAPEGWNDPFPWRGIVNTDEDATWRDNGTFSVDDSESRYDLIEVREPGEGWVPSMLFYNKESAAKNSAAAMGCGVIRVREIID